MRKVIAILLVTIFIFSFNGCKKEEDNDITNTLTLSISDTVLYVGQKCDLECVSVASITPYDIEFDIEDIDVLSIGKKVNGRFYVYAKAIGSTKIYAYRKNDTNIKSNVIRVVVTADKDIYITKENLNIANKLNNEGEKKLQNNRREELEYTIRYKGIKGSNNVFSFTSLDLDVSNLTIADIHIFGEDVITEVTINLKNPVQHEGDYIEMYVGALWGADTTVKFNFKAGSKKSTTTDYIFAGFLMFYALDGGIDLEIESILVDIKFFGKDQLED